MYFFSSDYYKTYEAYKLDIPGFNNVAPVEVTEWYGFSTEDMMRIITNNDGWAFTLEDTADLLERAYVYN